jgi:hypothetical protein
LGRMDLVRERVDQILSSMKNQSERQEAMIHLYGVSSCCSLLALRRGLNSEIAAISGLLHDIYAYRVGSYDWHSQNGADMVRVILRRMDCFDEVEQQMIQSAIFHHANKDIVHDAYDEVLKDADILQPLLLNGEATVNNNVQPRLKRIVKELGLSIDVDSIEIQCHTAPVSVKNGENKRGLLANIAENLAARRITGDTSDSEYMNLIRYWPEEDAYEEFQNGWCAAFVYHCCREAGFSFPIRWKPTDSCRFGCVAAWNSWAQDKDQGFFIRESLQTYPLRGDIVLYRNSIPPENKPADQRDIPIDHIGIVLGCDEEQITVAEGNVNNQNVSGIVKRPLHNRIEGYIRIDNHMVYTGWKNDYKSGIERVDPYYLSR